MSWNSSTQVMTKPIGWGDIALALGITSQDLGYLIKNGGIYEYLNKWSFRKPVRYNKWGQLTDEEIASVHCGLSPVVLSKLLLMIAGNDSTAYSYTETECRAEIDEWPYHYPRGLSYNEPFNSFDLENYHGYAVAPDSNWGEIELSSTELEKAADVAVTINTTSPYTGKNFFLTPYYENNICNDFLYSDFSMLFGSGSEWRWNYVYGMELPLNYITSLEGNWRLCMAVWLPNFNNNVGGWGIFCSRMTVAEFFDEGLGSGYMYYLFPDFATNTYAITLIQQLVTANNGYYEFDAVPLLINNLAYRQTSSSPYYYLPYADSSTVAYCMPSGMNAVTVKCGDPPVVIYGRVTIGSSGSLIIGTITNTHPTNTYTFGYTYTIYQYGVVMGSNSGTITLAAGESGQVAQCSSGTGFALEVKITSQTQV